MSKLSTEGLTTEDLWASLRKTLQEYQDQLNCGRTVKQREQDFIRIAILLIERGCLRRPELQHITYAEWYGPCPSTGRAYNGPDKDELRVNTSAIWTWFELVGEVEYHFWHDHVDSFVSLLERLLSELPDAEGVLTKSAAKVPTPHAPAPV